MGIPPQAELALFSEALDQFEEATIKRAVSGPYSPKEDALLLDRVKTKRAALIEYVKSLIERKE